MTTHKQEALEIALDNDIDYRKLLIDMMMSDPSAVVDLMKPDIDGFVKSMISEMPYTFMVLARQQMSGIVQIKKITAALKQDALVNAIKLLREDTKIDLKSAKDIIVSARDTLVSMGKLPNRTGWAPPAANARLASKADEARRDAIVEAFC